jgi:hypothetical protein
MLPDLLPLDFVIQIQTPERGDCDLLVHESPVEDNGSLLQSAPGPLSKGILAQQKSDMLLI